MSKKIDSLISNGICDLSNKAEHLAIDTAKELGIPLNNKNHDKLVEELNKMQRIVVQQNVLIHNLIYLISTNAFVSATISDKVIPSATAGSSTYVCIK